MTKSIAILSVLILCCPVANACTLPSQHCRDVSQNEITLSIRPNFLRGGGPTEGEIKRKKPRNIPTDNRLFISNLPRTLDDDALQAAFEKFGTIEEARVMRDIETGLSRRMGYVSFKESKAVDIAIDEMHETVLCAPPRTGGPEVCTRIAVAEAKPAKQTW